MTNFGPIGENLQIVVSKIDNTKLKLFVCVYVIRRNIDRWQ